MVLNMEERLYRFLQEHGNNRVKRELLLFWGMHPQARFDRRAVCYALDCNRLEAEIALGAMVDEGLLDKDASNGVVLYLLTTNEARRRAVLELAALSWDQWQSLLRRIGQRDRVASCPG